MSSLNQSDLQLLSDALDALEKKPMDRALQSSMIGMMLSKPEDRDKQAIKMDAEVHAAEAETRRLKDRICLTRAKLIGMRDAAEAESAFDMPETT